MFLTPVFLGIDFSLSLNLRHCEAAMDQQEVPYIETGDTKTKLEDAILQARIKYAARSCKELNEKYQNPGYYDIAAQDVSVWYVPNNADLEQWSATSLLRYHTENHFLILYRGNLFNLFKKFSMRFGIGACITDNGPAIPIVYDTGNVDYNKKTVWSPRK